MVLEEIMKMLLDWVNEQDKKIITRLLILEELEKEVKTTIKEEEKKFKLERRI